DHPRVGCLVFPFLLGSAARTVVRGTKPLQRGSTVTGSDLRVWPALQPHVRQHRPGVSPTRAAFALAFHFRSSRPRTADAPAPPDRPNGGSPVHCWSSPTNQARAAPLIPPQKQRDTEARSQEPESPLICFQQAPHFVQEIHPSFLTFAVAQVMCHKSPGTASRRHL